MTAATTVSDPIVTLTQSASAFSFEVKDIEKLATKVNGAAQYIFQVEFHNATKTEGDAKKIVAIPLHAMSMTKAVMMLEAFGRHFASIGQKELQYEVDHLGYSAVSIEREQPSKTSKELGYAIEFDRFDEKVGRFALSPHIHTIIDHKTASQLEKYAQDLEKKYAIPQTQPQLTLDQSQESFPSIALSQSNRDVVESNHDTQDLEALHANVGILCLRNTPEEVDDKDWEKVIKPYDKIFGEGFMEEVKTRAKQPIEESSLEELLTIIAWQKAQDLLKEEAIKELEKKLPNQDSGLCVTVRDFMTIANAVQDALLGQR